MRGPTLPLVPTKTHGPISVNVRDKVEILSLKFFSPSLSYLFSVQFILNELTSSYFLTFEIFVKISSLESLTTYYPENRKNIPTVSELDEIFLGHWISRGESNGVIRFIIRYLENFLGIPEPL